jgi:hypothetical protein
MSIIIEFIKYKPVQYTVHLSHDERGFSVQVVGVADDKESRKRVAAGLRKAAEMIDEEAGG